MKIERVEFTGSIGSGMRMTVAHHSKNKIELIGSEFIKLDNKFLIPMDKVQQITLLPEDSEDKVKLKIKKALE